MRASPATRWRPPRPTAPSGSSAAWGPTTASAERHEGYDPAIDSWKGGEDLPVPVQHAMAVTWQDTPVVLGGWRTDGANPKVATDQVWRVVNSRWTELPPLLQPRAAAAAAVVGDRIIVTGGVDAGGKLLNTTEIFDGTSWKLGAPIPTPRQMLGAASDGKLVYAVGGTNGTSDLTTVEAYDPAADKWATMPELPQGRSDFGVAITDGRLVVVGGMSAGQVLKSVVALDLTTRRGIALPDMGQRAPRHGGRRRRQDRLCDRRVDRRRRQPDHVVGRSAEAGTAQTAAGSGMAGAAGCADRAD